jgi:hypothetical protein
MIKTKNNKRMNRNKKTMIIKKNMIIKFNNLDKDKITKNKKLLEMENKKNS